jgi:signal transduction histidine kinase
VRHFGPILYVATLALTNLGLSILVFARNSASLVNRLFAVTVFFVSVWIFANGMLHTFADTSTGLRWASLTFAAASLIPATFLAFAVTFPSRRDVKGNRSVAAFVGLGIAFFGLAFSGMVVESAHVTDKGLKLTYGVLYPVFALYVVAGFGTSFVILGKKYRRLRGAERLRMRYLFAGTFLAVAGGATTNLLIPLAMRTSRFNLLGPLFTVFAVTFIAHAVVRHRLMDIRLILRRSTTFVLAFATCGLLIIGLPTIALVQLNVSSEILAWVVVVFVAIAAGFPPALRWTRERFDRYAYRAPYDESRTLTHVTRTLSSFLDRDALLLYIESVVNETVPTESVSFYLRNGDAGYRFYSVSDGGLAAGSLSSVHADDPIISHLRNNPTPLVREEVTPQLQKGPTEIFASLSDKHWDLVLPLRTDRELAGFIALGPKRSSDPFFNSDIDLLGAIASQTAVALANAALYQEVRDVKDHLEGILKNMEGGVVAVSANETITTVNVVAATLLGMQPSDLIAKPMSLLPAALRHPLRATISGGSATTQLEAELTTADGVKPIVLSTSLLKESQGSIRGAIMLFGDHSKLKELEEEKRRSERLGDFRNMAFGIAHEIKNPLVAIKTFAELLPERYEDTDFREGFLRIAVKEIDRIDELVARLRGVGEPESRPLQPLDVMEPLNDTLSLLQGQFTQRNIEIHREFAGTLPIIRGDLSQLKQLFLNVMLNAIEAMEHGGLLTVATRVRQHRDDSTWVVIDIADTGEGIKGSESERLFDPFVTTKPRGSGLGLSISRGIADAHRAAIRLASRHPVQGTLVTIEFPALRPVDAKLEIISLSSAS